MDTGKISAVIHFLMYGSYKYNQSREDLDERLSIKCEEDEVNFYSCSAKILEKDNPKFKNYEDPEGDVLYEKFDAVRANRMLSESESLVADYC